MNGLRSLGCACAAAALLALSLGCSRDDGGQAAAKPAAAKSAPKAAEPTAANTPEYHYDPTDKVDPFRSHARRQVTFDPEANSSPLEKFDLNQLSVSGIIWGVEEPRALIKDPNGKGYIVRAGTPIGKNKGRIVRIEENKVIVKETYLDHLDRATTKEVELGLYANGRNG